MNVVCISRGVLLLCRDGHPAAVFSHTEDLQCCVGAMLPTDSSAWVGLMRRLWLNREDVNSSMGSKCVMWGVAADTPLSCLGMGQCTHVVAMIWASWGTRSPGRNQVCDYFKKNHLFINVLCKITNLMNMCHVLEQVVALDAQIIISVSCGETHTLALNDNGQVFSWGLGSDGQLGLNNFEECVRVPR